MQLLKINLPPFIIALTLILIYCSEQTNAQIQDQQSSPQATQETWYVTDLIYLPVRSGAGDDYRILNKGLPSGTAVSFFGLSEDRVWAEVMTKGGTRGWSRARYLLKENPIDAKTNNLIKKLDTALTAQQALQAFFTSPLHPRSPTRLRGARVSYQSSSWA